MCVFYYKRTLTLGMGGRTPFLNKTNPRFDSGLLLESVGIVQFLEHDVVMCIIERWYMYS